MLKFKHTRKPVSFGEIDIETTLDQRVINRLDKEDLNDQANAIKKAEAHSEKLYINWLRKELDGLDKDQF